MYNRVVATALGSLFLVAFPILAQAPVFTDITEQAGVGLPNTLTESLAWGDFDNDGDPDLYLTNNGENKLFRNDGGGKFTDVTQATGVGNDLFSVGTAFGDLDNDGDLDLYVVNFQTGRDVLYRNDGPVGPDGIHRFTDIAEQAGIFDESSSRGMAFVDFDRDGLLDIYVNAIGPDILYRNLGDLRFVNVASQLGLTANGQGVGVVATDVNRDGMVDLYNGNRSGERSNLYINGNGGTFTDVATQANITASGLGMGVIALDFDNDLDMDLYWTTWPGEVGVPVSNRLYRNEGDLTFVNVTQQTGTADTSGWGVSANVADIDNDGWLDFFVTNGFSPSSGPNAFFRNQEGNSFENIIEVVGGGQFDGRGVAFADFDLDGDLDLCVTGGPDDQTRLWRNDTPNNHHFLSFKLNGIRSNASAIGSRIEVTAGGRTMVQEVSGGAGRGSFNDLPVAFGLGEACVADVVDIFWPNGATQRFQQVKADQFLEINEPVGVVPESYMVIGSAPRGDCSDCESLQAVIPWVVNNDQFASRVAFFNDGEREVRACLTAVTTMGERAHTEIIIPAKSVFAREAATLFEGLSGYSLELAGSEAVHASVITFSKETDSGRSPAQTTSIPASQLTHRLTFPYLPGTEIPAIVLAAPQETGPTEVVLNLYDRAGLVVGNANLTLQADAPQAILVRELFGVLPTDGAIQASTPEGVSLSGMTFVFNEQREPSMSRAINQ